MQNAMYKSKANLMLHNVDLGEFRVKKGGRVLDIGSAEGANSIGLRKAGYVVSALEIDPNLVRAFREDPETAGIEIFLGDALKMPFKDASFDGAILLEVIEHIENTDDLLKEIYRVLVPGGKLCIAVPTSYTEKVFWRLHPGYAKNATHVKIFSRRQLTNSLSEAGFKVTRTIPRNLVPAISWLFHALFRSRSDHTGKILEHHWIDRVIGIVFGAWSRLPLLKKLLGAAGRVIGKSWYFYCEKTA